MSRLTRNLRRWPVIVGLVVIVLAGGGVTAWAMTRSSGTPASSQLVAAAVNTVTSTVAASGTIEPAHQASLSFGADGRVTKVMVKTGAIVTKGQPLAEIARTSLVATKDAAAATLSAAAAKVAADDSSTSSVQLASDNAALSAAKSSLRSAKAALAAATLRATIAGTVTATNLTVGEQVSGGSSSTGSGQSGDGDGDGDGAQASDAATASTTSSSSSQVVIQSTTSFIVDATVDDTEISDVHSGQSVAVTPAGATAPVTGTVTSVSSVPTSSSGVVTFPIVVTVSGHPTGVYAGASATLTVTTKKSIKALEIPTLAVHYNGSQASVQVNDGHGVVTEKITVGTTYGLETQVLSGISAGDKVVVTIPTFGRGTTPGGTGRGGFGFGGGTGGFGGGGTGGFGGGTGTFGGRTGTGGTGTGGSG